MSKNKKIGMFGYGCVGQGFHDVLAASNSFEGQITKIGIKNATKARGIDLKYFTANHQEILEDEGVDIFLEVITEAEAAFEIVKTALQKGKPVVSANKKMIAYHMEELFALQQIHQQAFLYDAAVCGSIPIIRNIEEYYQSDGINGIQTICNGTTNYILTKVINENLPYAEVLSAAQTLGFAELDPKLDVEGYDAKYKLIILVAHAFGLFLNPDTVWNFGIQNISVADVAFAKSNGYTIKLLAKAEKTAEGLKTYVAPHFIAEDSPFYHVNDENNAVAIDSAFANQQFLVGKGAGSHPTGASVFSDVKALDRQYRYNYEGVLYKNGLFYNPDITLKIYCRFNDIADIQGLVFTNIEQQNAGFIIGDIALQTLINANLNERTGVFVSVFG